MDRCFQCIERLLHFFPHYSKKILVENWMNRMQGNHYNDQPIVLQVLSIMMLLKLLMIMEVKLKCLITPIWNENENKKKKWNIKKQKVKKSNSGMI